MSHACDDNRRYRRFFIIMNESLRIALPNGELKRDVVRFMGDVGLDITPTERGLFIPVENMPIEFVLVRAGDVPRVVSDDRSMIKVGITGSDILWENGIGKTAGVEVSIYERNPEAKKSSLFFGVSNDFLDYISDRDGENFRPQHMTRMMLATKYVNIAEEYIADKGMEKVDVLYVPGSDEGMQYVYPRCVGVIGIKSTGDTIRANNIEVIDQFHDVTLRMIQEAGKLSPREARVLEDFQETMEQGRLASIPLTTALL